MPTPLSRRTLLRGAGIVVGLPFLDAMLDRRGLLSGTAHAAPAPLATKLVTFFIPNGFFQSFWTPTQATAAGVKGYTPTRWVSALLEPDAGLPNLTVDDFNVLSGLRGTGDFDPAFNDSHGAGACNFSTASPGDRYRGAYGKSVDVVARDYFKAQGQLTTPIDSLPVCVQRDVDPTWFRHFHISYAGKYQPAQARREPLALYNELFTLSQGTTSSAADLARLLARRKSVLDFVRSDIARLNTQLGASDRARLDAHLNGVREMERRLAASQVVTAGPPPTGNYAATSTYEAWGKYSTKARMQIDLLAYALATDLTHIGSLMYWGSGDNGGPDEAFLKANFPNEDWQQHNQAHAIPSGGHADGNVHFDIMNAFTREQMKWFRYFLKKLKAAPSAGPGGTVLHNSIVYLGSEMGYGPDHSLTDFPGLIAGNASGRLQTGRAFDFNNQQHLGNLLVSLLDKMGIPNPSMSQDTPTASATVYNQAIPGF